MIHYHARQRRKHPLSPFFLIKGFLNLFPLLLKFFLEPKRIKGSKEKMHDLEMIHDEKRQSKTPFCCIIICFSGKASSAPDSLESPKTLITIIKYLLILCKVLCGKEYKITVWVSLETLVLTVHVASWWGYIFIRCSSIDSHDPKNMDGTRVLSLTAFLSAYENMIIIFSYVSCVVLFSPLLLLLWKWNRS